MKKLISIISILLVFAPLAFISCNKEEIKVTTLSAYGPLPVVRGESINFVGECLDKITEVVLPEGVVIPSSSFTDHSAEGFSIVVPQETMPGQVILKYGSKEIVAKVPISFEEPIKFADLDMPGEVLAGQEITISGDYLYNIVKVVFFGGVSVEQEDFVAQDRKSITLVVPTKALTGLIYLEDADENQYYSNSPITVSQPTITSMSPLIIKAGKDLTISGQNLGLVSKVIFAGNVAVELDDKAEFNATELVVTTPENLQDGTVTLVSYAGVETVSEEEIETILPTNIKLDAETVFKTGHNITITGDDLDLVSTFSFNGGDEIAADELYSNGEITVTIPENAIDGAITLNTLALKSVLSWPFALVIPTNLSTDKQGYMNEEKIIISGEDLDLVKSVTLNGAEEEFEYDGTSITVPTRKESLTGKLALILKNGVEVIVSENLVMTPKSEIIVKSVSTEKAQVGNEVTLEGTGFNKMESMSIGEVKVLEYIERSDSKVTFKVPEKTPEGEHAFEFVLVSGTKETSIAKITIIGAILKVSVWTGSNDFGGWSNFEGLSWNKTAASTTLMQETKTGATLVFEGTAAADAQLKIMNPNGWSVLPEAEACPGYEAAWGVINFPAGETVVKLKLSDATVAAIQAAGIVMGGKNFVMTEVYLEYPAN